MWIVFTGVCTGLAIMIRPTYSLFAISFAWLNWDSSAGRKNVLLYSFGNCLPWLALVITYALHNGDLLQLYHSIIRFNLDYYSAIKVPVALFTGGRGIVYAFAAIGLALIAVGKYRGVLQVNPESTSDLRLLVAMGLCSLLSPVIMGKYFSYHFAPLMLMAVAFASVGLHRGLDFIRFSGPRIAMIMLALGLYTAAFYPRHLLRYWFESLDTNNPLETVYERVLSDKQYGLQAQRCVIDYVDRKSRPDQPIECVSFFPSLRWRIARPEASQFTTPIPLAAFGKVTPDYILEWRREFIESLKVIKPRFVIISQSHEWWPFVNNFADSAVYAIPGLDSLLKAQYFRDTTIGGFGIYRKT